MICLSVNSIIRSSLVAFFRICKSKRRNNYKSLITIKNKTNLYIKPSIITSAAHIATRTTITVSTKH